jgi:hypothetical protein
MSAWMMPKTMKTTTTMKIQTKKIDDARGIMQITTTDERWYTDKNGVFVPSVTWIAGFYPKGVQFYKWLADKGWDEAEAIKHAAGDKGSKVHKAIEDILLGNEVRIDSKYPNPSTEKLEELTPQEYECVMSFVDWLKAINPKVLSTEYVVWNTEYGYAGTVDMKLKVGDEVWIVDVKTSPNIWPEYELQVSAYRHADSEVQKTGILQVGYTRNKFQKYKFTEIEDRFDLFLSARKIWAYETEGQQPSQKDYPLSLQWIPSAESTKVAKSKTLK